MSLRVPRRVDVDEANGLGDPGLDIPLAVPQAQRVRGVAASSNSEGRC